MIGTTILHYKILAKLGEGGMGVVYKAEDTKLKREVAIKFLPRFISANEEERKRFENEAQTAASLNHPNIAHIYAIEETDDEMFIVMELVDGKELKDIIKEKPVSIEEAVNIAIQIAEGLEAAHNKNIIHRDIKSANIMMTDKGQIKIMDFGLAKIQGSNQVTKIGTTIGTAAYMSPEQARGEELDSRTDIWSFGVVLYELITGHLPFKGNYEHALIYSIINEELIPVTKYSENCSSSLVRIVNKCLEKNPEDRYETAGKLLEDLEIFQVDPDYGFKTKAIKINRSSSKKSKVKKILAVSSIIISVLILSFILPSGWQKLKNIVGMNSTPAEQHLLILPFTNIGGDESKQIFCDGLMETLSSNLTRAERLSGSLWVIPASEVIRNKINSPKEAYQMYGANLAVTGSLQFLGNMLRLTLNLVDAEKLRQLSSSVIDISKDNISSLQDQSVIKLLEMLNIELDPGREDLFKAGETLVPEAYEYYVQGRGYLQRYENLENVDEAIKYFTLSTEADTSYSLAYAGLGEANWRKYESTKNSSFVDEAVKDCQRAFKLDSVLAPVNVTLGIVYSGIGRYEDAVKQFNRALSNDPTNSEAYRGLAKVYESLEQYDDAESTFKRAIGLKPDYWAGYNDLGVFYYKNGRYEEAIGQFKKVIELTPDNYRGYNNLGGIYYMLERWGDARAMFEQSLRVRKSYNIYSNLATLYYIEGNYEDAAKTYEQALELNDKDYLTWGNLAAAYYGITGKKEKAIKTYKKAIEIAEENLKINPSDPEVNSNLASYYADVDDSSKALKFLTNALISAPDNVMVMYRAATTYEHLGNREKALYWIGKAIENGYSRSEIENQPELKNLVADERYKNLTEKK